MKILWTGSDSLFLIKYPPSRKVKYIYMFCLRIYARLADFFCQEHYAVSAGVRENLIKFGMKKPIYLHFDPVMYPVPFAKINHSGFNVLFYSPKRNTNPPYKRWVYGIDIFEYVRGKIKDINWIVIDGSQDMSKIFPIIDFYLRPNRHDGNPRLVKECKINDIPYYWSKDGNPNINEIIETIKRIRDGMVDK